MARAIWHPDITIELGDGRTLIIEYDGAYWHKEKSDLDTAKTRDLLAAGLLVARCREYPLPPLAVEDPHYLEVTVYSAAPDATYAMEQIADWCVRNLGTTTHDRDLSQS